MRRKRFRRLIIQPLAPVDGTARKSGVTPWSLFRQIDQEFHFTLDVCASADNAKCARYFSRSEDGLVQDWSGEVCWMNPPFGREIAQWVAKARREAARGGVVVALLPVRSDTAWWHDHVIGAEIRFLRGRVCFTGGTKGPASHNAPFPCAIVVFPAHLQETP